VPRAAFSHSASVGKRYFLPVLALSHAQVRGRRIPIYSEQRILVAIRGAAAMVVGLRPVRDLILRNDTAARPESGIVVARIVAELSPLAVGHFMFGDVVRVEIHHVDRTLAGLSIAGVIATS
jgi:hypothetical protein